MIKKDLYHRFGWRARLGVLSRGVVCQNELFKMKEGLDGVALVISSSGRIVSIEEAKKRVSGFSNISSEKRFVMGKEEQLEEWINLTTVACLYRPDVISTCCTLGSFGHGVGWDERMIKKIEETADHILPYHVPAMTTSTAVRKALEELNAKKVAIATPYPEWMARRLKEFMEGNGIDVVDISAHNLYKTMGTRWEDCPYGTIYKWGKDIDNPEADVVFISCVSIPATDVIQPLEEDLRKPVITSVQATMWQLLRLAGVQEQVRGYGELLKR